MNRRASQVVRHCSRLLHYLNVAFVGMLFMVCFGLAGLTLRLSNGPIDLSWIAVLYGNSFEVTHGGVRLAYMALMDTLAGKRPAKRDGFTAQQRLFLGFAQVWCENLTDESARLRVQPQPH